MTISDIHKITRGKSTNEHAKPHSHQPDRERAEDADRLIQTALAQALHFETEADWPVF